MRGNDWNRSHNRLQNSTKVHEETNSVPNRSFDSNISNAS